MCSGYTDETNVQILIALMKHHGVRRVVASPGTTNIAFVASLQHDSYFTVYSAADERSAAYIACGMAAESGQPVALSCTGATASRNYLPGLTEAYYRKLPILAVTSAQHLGRIGSLTPQVIDRTNELNDVCKISVQCPSVHDADDRWACETNLNRALLELTHHGGGPVHINLVTKYSGNFGVSNLPAVRCIDRIELGDELPELIGKRIAVYVGAHTAWSEHLAQAVDRFCELYGAVVLGDHTSNYAGEYGTLCTLVAKQSMYVPACKHVDVMIHIGEISGAYASPICNEVWRVNPDGEPRDAFNKLRYVFDMKEEEFFDLYNEQVNDTNVSLHLVKEWRDEDTKLRARIPDLPFSNIWCAQQTAPKLPKESVLHLGILNTLRSWNFFPVDSSIRCYANTGGFGIDGCMSSLIGASLAAPDKLFFGVIGDLACFYDLNSLGNRHVGANLRVMIINNGVGTEFKNYDHKAARFGQEADEYVAARGHYGNQSHTLLKHYAQDLGFEYMSATNKDEFLSRLDRFTASEHLKQPILFEVFTDSMDESGALHIMQTLEIDNRYAAKQTIKKMLGDKGVTAVKKILKR
ncbi:2-succinyl-5-enolpyruvyl-6-hydroxy-3-cyclohexene-1-carboxylate synthase [Bifidobacterium pullorum subsp. saeculare]|uniref:thiamine pyrophosphate-binding protein n=1 Tax=Bifidobacterium pullorum TaxID=78448 RepID=UPI001DD3D74B|nr:thiamine pyrophosphate-binding protein [Bifidobacterium pullorum]MBM6693097.1 2-succinyl-5-enolpyruvyl-6-hydroxy-3-cyclohexene-1-carboxylate synthase [Bifidobacterium pullorum subsp. saeculare]